MPTLPVPLFTRSYKNADGVVLTDDAFVQYNGFLDPLQGLNIRPGESLAINSERRIDGLFHWPDKNRIVCVENAKVYFRNVSGNQLVTLISCGTSSLNLGNPIIFAADSNYVLLAGGGKIHHIDQAGSMDEVSDTDAPTQVSHVAFLDGYILANNVGSDTFYWADVNSPTSWNALSFATAEGNPDATQGIYVIQRQIYLLGTVSTEIWENDGSSPFSRIPGGLIEVGCGAKYSPIKRGDSLVWLSENRQFVEFTGTSVKFISSRYDKEIEDFDVVSDCIGCRIFKKGVEFCLFQFPTEQRTLAYCPATEDWSEWGRWSADGMTWKAYDIRASVRDLNTGKTFIGKGDAKLIAYCDADSTVDLLENAATEPFKFLRQTGFIDHGTSKKKRLEELRFRAKRGSQNQGETPQLMFRYRNDGESQWSNIKQISLGAVGDTMHHVRMQRLGIYKSRQFEISATDDIPLVFSNAEADITVLR